MLNTPRRKMVSPKASARLVLHNARAPAVDSAPRKSVQMEASRPLVAAPLDNLDLYQQMAHTPTSYFHLHLISDSTGETLTTIAKCGGISAIAAYRSTSSASTSERVRFSLRIVSSSKSKCASVTVIEIVRPRRLPGNRLNRPPL